MEGSVQMRRISILTLVTMSAKGPHGGGIVELGEEEFHAEVVLDHDAHSLRVFLLGPDMKTAATTAATELTLTPEDGKALTLKAAPQDGESDGKASRFEIVDEAAVHDLLDAKMIHGDLKVKIGDKEFSGHVDYHLDDVHHEHKDAVPKTDEAKPDETKGDAAKEDGTKDAATPEAKPADDAKDAK
jgi:hypothetical protein